MKPNLLAAAAATAGGLPSSVASSGFFVSRRGNHSPSSTTAFLSSYDGGRRSSPRDVCRGSATTATTTSSSALPSGKGDLYGDDELFELLNLHRSIANAGGGVNFFDDGGGDLVGGGVHDWVLRALEDDNAGDDDGDDHVDEVSISSGGVHDWVLRALENDAGGSCYFEEGGPMEDDSSANQLAYDNLRTLLRDRKPSIRAIATDVDGTLLSGRYLHPTTRDAILRGIRRAYESDDDDDEAGDDKVVRHFFPATGKTRAGVMDTLGPEIASLLRKCPGVYVQGLYCVDGDGNVVFERKLPRSAVRAAEALAADFGISVVAYDGDDLYATDRTDVVVRLSEYYGEPVVNVLIDEGSGRAMGLAEHGPGMHKLLLMDEDLEKLATVRPRLEELARTHDATVTQALPAMLELLPAGCSKAYGVERVCEALGVDPSVELLALGDAENDSGMLRLASIGVAVGNACPQARDAADFIMKERSDEGGAGLAMNLFGF